jgi:hypothetical protein
MPTLRESWRAELNKSHSGNPNALAADYEDEGVIYHITELQMPQIKDI